MNPQPSSTSKGTQFEDEAFAIILKLVKAGRFIVPDKLSKAFQKKGYYSSQRDSNIIFDITIETYLPGATDYSLLTVFECKNLNASVSVDDVEEFSRKLSQIGEHNIKGIMITTNSFQRSTLKFAKSTGIALVRITNRKELNWILPRTDSKNVSESNNEIEYKLTDLNYNSEPFIGISNGTKISNFADLLQMQGVFDWIVDVEEFIKIPFLKEEKLKKIIQHLENQGIYNDYKMDVAKLLEVMETAYKVKFYMDTEEDKPYLGKIIFNPLEIKISKSARIDSNRWRFTLAHEIAHLILHKKILESRVNEKIDNESNFEIHFSSTKTNKEILEIQANILAGYMLLPESKVRLVMHKLFSDYAIPKRKLFLDHQQVNRNQVYEILTKISNIFEVSIEAIKIRFKKLDLLEDKTQTNIGTLIRRNNWQRK